MDSKEPSRRLLRCLERAELVAFSTGKLDRDTLEVVGEHLIACGNCTAALQAIEDDGGSLAGEVRQLFAASTPEDEPECRLLEARAREIPIGPAERLPASQPGEAGGQRIMGQYQLVEKIGQGGMGSVYRAVHRRLKRWVAIKVLPPAERGDAGRARFEQEMEAIVRVEHPNIVRATDAGEADGVHYLVMELVDGVDLAALVRLCGPLPIADACELARQTALGLQCVADHGLVHRDVKPSNVMLAADGTVKVLDLGLALLGGAVTSSDRLTEVGQVIGTADFMAPEQWAGSRTVDIRADLYSLGCTLFKLLTGNPPFGGPDCSTPLRKMAAHAEAPVPVLAQQREDVPAELSLLVSRLLAKSPADRYQHPRDVAAALGPLSAGASLTALVAAARARQAEPPTRPGDESIGPAAATRAQHVSSDVPQQPVAVPASVAPGRRRSMPYVAALLLGVLLVAVVLLADSFFRPGPGELREPGPRPQPGEWFPLLRSPPRKVLVADRAGDSVVQYDRRKQRFALTSVNVSLWGLGEAPEDGYRLQVGMDQLPWSGHVGVFFGYQEKVVDGQRRMTYQLLEVRKHPPGGDRDGPQFFLERHLITVRPTTPGRFLFDCDTRATAAIPEPRGEQTLELEVRKRGLFAVRWAGVALPELVTVKANAGLGPEDYAGDFGIYAFHSSGVFRNAQFLLFQGDNDDRR